ncbi:hypothetical protein GCM10010954_08700 [Halobacillus andaensis]|uniref:Uncharacterized protein n=1 Tax=Halobacillus andaensis TaxID=1176239 RepID=A0A917AZ98_HALAA|nr:hypothetical protein GCM10010954_08700 [Halobacillus andaensis]
MKKAFAKGHSLYEGFKILFWSKERKKCRLLWDEQTGEAPQVGVEGTEKLKVLK